MSSLDLNSSITSDRPMAMEMVKELEILLASSAGPEDDVQMNFPAVG